MPGGSFPYVAVKNEVCVLVSTGRLLMPGFIPILAIEPSDALACLNYLHYLPIIFNIFIYFLFSSCK
jgi:hypothetical protein